MTKVSGDSEDDLKLKLFNKNLRNLSLVSLMVSPVIITELNFMNQIPVSV